MRVCVEYNVRHSCVHCACVCMCVSLTCDVHSCSCAYVSMNEDADSNANTDVVTWLRVEVTESCFPRFSVRKKLFL